VRRVAFLALAAALLPSPVPAAPTKGTQDFEFGRLNHDYRDVAGALEPTQAGPFRIDLSTPRQEVTLLRHRLRLARRDDGTHDAELRAEYRGRGRLVASASVLGFGQSFQDDVTLPGQALTLQARVRIARGRDGYLVTTVALPAEAEVLIQSRLGGSSWTGANAWRSSRATASTPPCACDRAPAARRPHLPPGRRRPHRGRPPSAGRVSGCEEGRARTLEGWEARTLGCREAQCPQQATDNGREFL